ncbi:MAG: AarF/ABC1/UbiB kinase family protein [Eggerthellaceae bacterium]|nr:AarF/ABC1/UbiB kinase family protein [Eggerthellaceae bacterium]
MASFPEMMMKARKRSKEENEDTNARFKEILDIVKAHDLKSGLTPEKAVALLQDLGTTFVKLGQIASTHPDVLPAEYCDAFGKLRTQARPLAFADVKAQVEAELGKPLDELFAEFDEEPAGSASIAQVHRAQLADGTEVAVKVQRPGVVETVTSDLAIMERLVDLYDLVVPDENGLSVKELVDEMTATSKAELDFGNEAANLERFFANNEPREKVTSPRCYRDYTTAAVLTEDFASSPCAEDIEEMGLSNDERDELAYLVANNYMQQFMEDGFYHADPHAGNVLILPDRGIEWIDFGMMGTITSSQRDTLESLILALVKGDSYGLKRDVLKIAKPKGAIDHAALLELCESMASQFIDVDLESFDTAALMTEMMNMLKDQGFDIDPFVMNLGRGLVTLEGTIHLISPRLNIMKVLVDYLQSTFDPSRIKQKAQRMTGKVVEGAEAMASLPTKAVETLDMAQKGQLRLNMELSSDERFARDLRAAASLLSLALVATALIIGFCILGASDAAPRVGGVSIAGGIGLVCGVALTVYVIAKSRHYLK